MDTKKITISAIALGLILVAIILFVMRSDATNIAADVKGKTVWLKCENQECAEVFEMPILDYSAAINSKPADITKDPAVKCIKCGKDSALLVEKCEQCGNVFAMGKGAFGDFADRCPKCRFSKTEEARKQQ